MKILNKYKKRLIILGLFKAFLIALIPSFISMGVISLISYFCNASLSFIIILTLSIGLSLLLILTIAIFFKFFYPNNKKLYSQLDKMGLEERLITLKEIENDNSLFADLLKKDVDEKLKNLPVKSIRFVFPIQVIIMIIFSFIFASSFMTYSVIASTSIDPIQNQEEKEENETEYFIVNYGVLDEKQGTIEGLASQKVKKGGYTKQVKAVPFEGYVFYAWTNLDLIPIGNQEATRMDLNIQDNMDIVAIFQKKEDDENDQNMDSPSENPDDKEGNEDTSKNDKEDTDNKDEEDDSNKKPDSSGGKVDGNDQDDVGEGRDDNSVIDGTKDYQDDFDREKADQDLSDDLSIPDDLKDLLGDYYDILKPTVKRL